MEGGRQRHAPQRRIREARSGSQIDSSATAEIADAKRAYSVFWCSFDGMAMQVAIRSKGEVDMKSQQIAWYRCRGINDLLASLIRRPVYLLSTIGLVALALVLTGCVPGAPCC